MNTSSPTSIKQHSWVTIAAIVAVLVLIPNTILQGAPPTLKVGNAAPTLQVSKWVQGEPIKAFEPGKVYLVEFWATWCGPCRVSIPHLNELHTKYANRGLNVIGQDVWEHDQSLVAPFVKKMGKQMTYRVALDTITEGRSGKMAETWMDASGQTGIPTAFVVDQKGHIAWIGHPMELKEPLLEEILSGHYDTKKAAVEYEEQQRKDQQVQVLWRAYQKHRRAKEWEQAEKTVDEMEKLLPEDQQVMMSLRRFDLLLDQKQYDAAYQLAAQVSESHSDNVLLQNSLAWDIATRDDIEQRDLKVAEKIARRAVEASKGTDPDIIDTLARVLFLQGQQQAAIELEQKAVELAEGSRQQTFQKILDRFKEGKLPVEQEQRTLWRQFNEHRQKKEWDKADSLLGEIEKISSEEDRLLIDRRRLAILLDRQDYARADKLATQLTAANQDKPLMLNEIAWEIAIRENVEANGLDVAERIIRKADDATQGKNAEILDTLARILFLKDQKQEAIKVQEKAVSAAQGRRKEQFQETLDSYKEGKTPAPY